MVRGLVLASLLTAVAGLADQQTTPPVISARLTTVREPTTDLLIHITNLRSVPLEHYAVVVGGKTIFWHRSITSREHLPVRSGQKQSERIALADADSARPAIVLLGFSDGYFEGEREVLQRYFLERGTPPGSSIADKRPTFVDGRSATLTAVPVPGERVVKILENLRKIPIEAWTIAYLAEGSESGLRTDMCSSYADALGQGAIAPGESRRFVSQTPEEVGAPVEAELRMVLFRDGYFEGSRSEVDQVIAQRKARGLTCARYH